MSEGTLKGKVAIVTGGSRGIGREISIGLAAQGASVVIIYQGNVTAANETVSRIAAASGGGRAIAVKGNISVAADVIAAFDKTVEVFGGVHIVAHVAAITLDNHPNIVATTEEDWDRTFATNAKGTFLVSKEAAKRLGPGGRIITTSSTLAATTMPGYAAYAASKSAVETFTKILAKELRGRKITVNCIAPSAVATASGTFFQGKTQEEIDFARKQSPLERLGQPKDISSVVQFLASDAAEWVNGQVIRLNGGVI